jgi:hypothetical protein
MLQQCRGQSAIMPESRLCIAMVPPAEPPQATVHRRTRRRLALAAAVAMAAANGGTGIQDVSTICVKAGAAAAREKLCGGGHVADPIRKSDRAQRSHPNPGAEESADDVRTPGKCRY